VSGDRGAALVLAAVLSQAPARAVGATAAPTLAGAVDARHARLVTQLAPAQRRALAAAHPGYRLIALCRPGGAAGELLVGLWKPVEAPRSHMETRVDPVGLIKTKAGWAVHGIEDEIADDARKTDASGVHWEYTFEKARLAVEMKCGAASEFGPDSSLTYVLGDKPLFDLKEKGLQMSRVTCLATDSVYNNWDCVVYSPSDGRYRLWFRQAHAD